MSHPVNPEAGDVEYPTDPAAVAVAQRSAAVIWRAIPYFAFRYDGRGRRFGDSDVGYLVAAAAHGEEAYVGQVTWLARVLSSRGMPSFVLECQLRHLARAAARRGLADAAAIAAGHAALRERRHEVADEPLFERLSLGFAGALGAGGRRVARGTGQLVVSALVDVRTGLVESAAPTLDWLRGLDDDGGTIGRAIDDIEQELGEP